MSLSDTDFSGSLSVNDAAYGLDQHAAVSETPGVFESLQNVVTKGIPLTGLSVVNSFANTAIDVGNWFSDQPTERLSVENEVGDGELLDYYKQHEQGIEAAGLAAGSIIPGTIAVKALKLAQAGRATLALQRATGFLSGPKQAIIDGALKDIASEGIYPTLQADKFKAIALGVGDQALQALVFETATIATMKASPLLDKDSFGDVVNDMFYGALVGGGIGGVIEGIGTRAILNRAVLNRDIDTKFAELATYLEGNKSAAFNAGDKVVALLDSLDDLPATSTDLLANKKIARTRETAMLNSKNILSSIVSEGDNELSNKMMDVLLHMKNEQGMDKESMYNYLANIGKISRIDEAPAIPKGNTFFVNQFVKGDTFDWNDLVSNERKDGVLARRYALTNNALEPKIAKFSDTMDLGNGIPVLKYENATKAFEDGNDMFIGRNKGGQLQVYINKDAPNIKEIAFEGESRPLSLKERQDYTRTGKLPEGSRDFYGAPITLNVRTGRITSDAIASVVGDFGTVSVLDKGLQYGSRVSLQSIASPITAETSTIDANARYVWAAKRGIKRGDNIAANDTAMLQQLHSEISGTEGAQKDWTGTVEKYLARKDISFKDGDVPLTTEDALLSHIQRQKDELIADTMNKFPKLPAEEVAVRANVSEDYLANNMIAGKQEDFLVDTAQHESVNHVHLEYNMNGTTTQPNGMIVRGLMDVQYRISVIKSALRAATAGFFGDNFENFLASLPSSTADIRGAGAGGVSFSNAPYSSLGNQVERIGKFVTDKIVKQMASVSQRLNPAVNAIRGDEAASAELGNFIQVRRMTAETYSFLPEDVATAEKMSPDTVVLSKSLKTDKQGVVTWDKGYTPEGFISTAKKLQFPESEGLHTFYSLSDKVADFERANMEVNNDRLVHRNNWYQANGISRTLQADRLYAPPIDTKKYPFFAFVKARAGSGMATDDVAVITAKDAAELKQKTDSLGEGFSVYFKNDLKTFHEVQGDYDFSRNFMQTEVNTALQKRGILNNILPDTRAETIIRDYVDWHSKQETRLIRDFTELGNGQLFAELRAMGSKYASAEMSKTGLSLKDLGRTAKNPYDDYVKTALGISTKEEYRLWADANDRVEAFFSTAFNTAKTAFLGAKAGLIPYEEAAAMSAKFGLGNPYERFLDGAKAYTDIANKLPPERYLSKFVSAANSVLAATAIRLDVFQTLINVISTPVMLLAEANSAAKLLTTELPDGSGRSIPAVSKVIFQAVKNYFDPVERGAWLPRYQQLGIVRNKTSEYFQMIDELKLPFGALSESEILKKISSFTDKAANLTGSNKSEEFVRYIAADSGRQIFEAAGHSGQQLTDNIATFVNRVHGNYIASQRPVAFQGPIGQAIGLFQTYQFNLMQQLFRYVENGEGKTIAMMGAMQTTLFGLQGLPGFQAINNHIVGNAANNVGHKDLYSTIPSLIDPKLGDYLLYGVVSNWMNTGLYSRGDINPRNITILPVNPLDYPAIAGGIKFVGNLLDTATKISQQGNIPTSLMLGLEHNGLSRPLTGIAQLAQGFSTTTEGKLVSTNTLALNDLQDAANYSRLLGARPLDEAIVMDAMYRATLYKAKDADRIKTLGEAIKTTLYDGQSPTENQVTNFAHEYSAAGGHIQNFQQHLMQWSLDANSSVANQLYRHLKSPINQQIQIQMGGVPLPDFASQAKSLTAAPQQ